MNVKTLVFALMGYVVSTLTEITIVEYAKLDLNSMELLVQVEGIL